MIQNKVSSDEMKNYFDSMNSIKYNPLQEEIRDEIMTLKRKVEDNANHFTMQVQSLKNQGQMGVPQGSIQEISRVEKILESKIQVLQEQLDDKASKSSVAEALHRKVSKQDFDENLGRKAELTDIERIFKNVDMKVDLNAFHELKAAIDAKADKYEIEGLSKVPNFEVDNRMQ